MSHFQFKLITVSVITFLADFLFYRHIIGGLSIAIYSIALLLGILTSEKNCFSSRKLLGLFLASATLIAANILRPNFWSLLLLVLCFFSIMIVLRQQIVVSVFDLCKYWLFSFFSVFVQWLRDLAVLKKWLIQPKGINFKGYFVAFFFSGLFIVLFSIANPVIEEWLLKLSNCATIFPEFTRVFFWFSFFVCTWSYLHLQYPKRNKKQKENTPEESDKTLIKYEEEPVLNPKEIVLCFPTFYMPVFTLSTIVICLVMFNTIFAVQNVLDILFLWRKFELPEGMTYAKYAHRGSYPLVFTVLLAAFFVLVTFRNQTKNNGMAKARVLVYIWLLQNVFLTISAFLRLKLYIEIYTLTRWRISALIWMVIIAVGLIWILVRILKNKSSSWLININFATVFLVLYICAFCNIDGFIADYNVNHSQFQMVDIEYLESLGIESLPALSRFIENYPESSHTRQKALQAKQRLQNKLQEQLSNWRGWCYIYYAIQKSLKDK